MHPATGLPVCRRRVKPCPGSRLPGSPGVLLPAGSPDDLCPVCPGGQTGLVRVIVTRIEWDGTMQRRMVDTAHRGDGPQWEDLAARALAILPLYRPVPRIPVYYVKVDDTVVQAAEHDLTGALLDLITAVLALGEKLLRRTPGKFATTVPDRAWPVSCQCSDAQVAADPEVDVTGGCCPRPRLVPCRRPWPW